MRMSSTPRQKALWLTALAVAVLAFAPGTASADLVDPATLHVSSANATGTDPVNLASDTTVTVTQVPDSNQATIQSPFLLILGIPDTGSGTTPPTVTAVNGNSTSISGTTAASWYLDGSKGHTNAYDVLGVTGPTTGSENWQNWSGSEITSIFGQVQSFQLYEYSIPKPIDPQGTVSVTFDSLLAGSYVIAYGQASDGTPFSTPFTHAGLETGGEHVVPEPASIALALTGLAGFGIAGLRRLRRRATA